MITQPLLLERIRHDLRDLDPGDHRWDDAQLARHLEAALTEFGLACPREATATLATTPGSRSLDLAALDGLVEVEAVEYPVGGFPPRFIGFGSWGGVLTLHSDHEPDGSDAKLYFTARHQLDADGSSLTREQADLVAMGAGALAALEQSLFLADQLTTGGERTAERYGDWGRARLTAFRQLLFHYGRRNRVRQRRLYRPA